MNKTCLIILGLLLSNFSLANDIYNYSPKYDSHSNIKNNFSNSNNNVYNNMNNQSSLNDREFNRLMAEYEEITKKPLTFNDIARRNAIVTQMKLLNQRKLLGQ